MNDTANESPEKKVEEVVREVEEKFLEVINKWKELLKVVGTNGKEVAQAIGINFDENTNLDDILNSLINSPDVAERLSIKQSDLAILLLDLKKRNTEEAIKFLEEAPEPTESQKLRVISRKRMDALLRETLAGITKLADEHSNTTKMNSKRMLGRLYNQERKIKAMLEKACASYKEEV